MQILQKADHVGETDPAGTGRIAVVRDRHLVPLIGSGHSAPPAAQPWHGILLEQHLVQAGEIPEHEHPDLCLHLQISGHQNFEWWSGGRQGIEQTRPGSLILIPPGTADRLHWTGASDRLILSIHQSRFQQLLEEHGASEQADFLGSWAFHDTALRHLVLEMGRQARSGWPLGALYADLLALGLNTQLLKRYSTHPVAFPPRKGGLTTPRLRRAMEFLNAHLAEEVRLEAVAHELGVSPSHLAHEFRSSTGQTPYQYLLDQRIARAKNLLQHTASPVQYISGLVGFSSPANFVRAFRERVGTTPAAWRKDVAQP